MTPWTSSTRSSHSEGRLQGAPLRMMTLSVNLHLKALNLMSSACSRVLSWTMHLTASFVRTTLHCSMPCSPSQARNSFRRSSGGAMMLASSSGVRYWPYASDLGSLTALRMACIRQSGEVRASNAAVNYALTSNSETFCWCRENQITCGEESRAPGGAGSQRSAMGLPWPRARGSLEATPTRATRTTTSTAERILDRVLERMKVNFNGKEGGERGGGGGGK